MYQIISGGAVVAVCDAPRYIRKNPTSGSFVECPAEWAEGVAVGGAAYNLPGRSHIPGAAEAVVRPVDGGEIIFRTEKEVAAVGEASEIAFVVLAEAGGIDDVTAGEHAELFPQWAHPVAYKTGNIRQYGGTLYRCVQAHTSQEDWTPDVTGSLWSKTHDPAEEWPQWSQPVGSHDAYSAGAKVSHSGRRWTSDVDGNVWEPGVYGWTEAAE